MDKAMQAAVRFFKSEQAYQKLFAQFKKKYESLGRIGGTVPVRLFTEKELEVIGGFFGMPGSRLAEKGSISVVAFERQLADTRFGDVELKALLDAYFGEVIISKKQWKQEKTDSLRRFIEELRAEHAALGFWFDHLLENSADVRWIWTLIDKEPDCFAVMAARVDGAYRHLPVSPERLPMFSQRITGDPHAFDLQTDLGKLWLHLLAVAADIAHPFSTEAINELLQDFNIYRDDLLNYVTCAGLYAETADGMHPVWKAAVGQNTVQIVPIRELVPLTKIYPSYGSDVWIVENSGVCATLLDYKPDASIVCTNGQFTLAALMLLDRLTESECTLHYAGDFDPEGLGMAQRLLDRYPGGRVQLWHMDGMAYAESNPVKELSEERLEKLNRIEHPRLVEVADLMKAKGKAGYQEALVERMVKDIL
ncbi:TIGR02679 family protein [Lentibacillus salicampi]|uniref:TIGR02679 family protein n=1 Tax=Lentibacillus salicampi TaxID=175306 RepID=A0A4Y9AEH9_9BACI|nr:TIGR02679 family protein [Lentibacillus salicampi]TFJ94289.1 TIGR02679 family protein [Lentibacillus salicampi]